MPRNEQVPDLPITRDAVDYMAKELRMIESYADDRVRKHQDPRQQALWTARGNMARIFQLYLEDVRELPVMGAREPRA